MTHVADIMYKALRYREGYISTKELATSMNVLDPSLRMDDRKLRGHQGEAGLLQSCSREIFLSVGYFIVRRMQDPPGVKLTNDLKELESATEQWNSFVWHLKRGILDEYEYYRQHARGKSLGPLFDGA